MAKLEGNYDMGMMELTKEAGIIKERTQPEVLLMDIGGNDPVILRCFEVDRGVTWDNAEKVFYCCFFF